MTREIPSYDIPQAWAADRGAELDDQGVERDMADFRQPPVLPARWLEVSAGQHHAANRHHRQRGESLS
jgi:hypothetical protein